MDDYVQVEKTMEIIVMQNIKAISINLYRVSQKINDIDVSESFLSDLF
jgi:hypothetical protein